MILDYLEQCQDLNNRVNEAYEHPYNFIPAHYAFLSGAFPDFATALQDLPNPLNRDNVFNFFANGDVYKGFVAAMIWGGLNFGMPSRGHAGDKTTTDFYRALSTGRDEITARLNNVKALLSNNNVATAYQYLENEGHINGIGQSYFTKLLYFLGDKSSTLIKDRWGDVMHYCLLIDRGEEEIANNCYSVSRVQGKIEVKQRFGNNRAQVYLNYVSAMNDAVASYDFDAGHLEAFLFGKPMRGRNSITDENPRFHMLTSIGQHLHI